MSHKSIKEPEARGRYRVWRILGVIALTALVSAELFARFVFGLGDPPLYMKTPLSQYTAIPNQHLIRFGNHVDYDSEGLRSPEFSQYPAKGVTRVLTIGDSICNGGVLTDQAKTYSYQLMADLNQPGGRKFEVLNASNGGWASENELGFLKEHGLFHSKILLMELGTNDLFQGISSSSIVGTTSFPDHKPICALQEGYERYFIPRYMPKMSTVIQDPGVNYVSNAGQFKETLATLKQINSLVSRSGARFELIFMKQPDTSEPTDPTTSWSEVELFQWLTKNKIPWTCPAGEIRTAGGSTLFRDALHPNPAGNKIMASNAATLLLTGRGSTNMDKIFGSN